MTSRKIKIAFLTYRLQIGGAERQLCLIARSLDKSKFEAVVIAIYGGGALSSELETSGIRVLSPNKRNRWDLIGFLARLRAILRDENPDIVYSMSDYANVLNQILRVTGGRHRTVWGLRASDNRPATRGIVWHGIFLLSRILEKYADHLVSNSAAGLEYYRSVGYKNASAQVIPNGTDTDRFHPDDVARQQRREEWRAGDRFVVGFLGRIQPKKDLACFLAAAERLKDTAERYLIVIGGDTDNPYGVAMKERARDLGVEVIWLGSCLDVNSIVNGFDLFCLTSAFGEGHPNALCEAMAATKPVISSDCGDAAAILDDQDALFAPGDDIRLAELVRSLEEKGPNDRKKIGTRHRNRIMRIYSVERLIDATSKMLMALPGLPPA
ncbi:MAG: glycosyltransferase [Alphaproteobacteria bacterium]|nr:glycosyltransferase [Alphaproteobacteria bacterium]